MSEVESVARFLARVAGCPTASKCPDTARIGILDEGDGRDLSVHPTLGDLKALIARLERAEKALEQAGGTLLKVLESDKKPYMVSFKAQYKDIRKLDAPELAAWLKERR